MPRTALQTEGRALRRPPPQATSHASKAVSLTLAASLVLGSAAGAPEAFVQAAQAEDSAPAGYLQPAERRRAQAERRKEILSNMQVERAIGICRCSWRRGVCPAPRLAAALLNPGPRVHAGARMQSSGRPAWRAARPPRPLRR